jgi:hypothetical protein
MLLGSVLLTACASAATQHLGAVSTQPAAEVSNQPGLTPSRSSQRFTSDRYGFGLVLPSSWQTQRASTAWASGVLEGRCPSDWDCFSESSEARTLAIAAIDVPLSETLGRWQATIHASAPAGVKDSDPPSETTLGGQPALAWTAASVDEGVNVIKLVALRGRRAYAVLFVSPMTTSPVADHAVFDGIIGTFQFTDP